MAAPIVGERRIAKGLLCIALVSGVLLLVSTGYVVGVSLGEFRAVVVGAGAIGCVSAEIPYEWPGGHPVHAGPVFLDRNTDPLEWWFLSETGSVQSVWAAPLWMPLVGTLVPGIVLERRTRHVRGHCRVCRYDLSGLPGGSPCPECGQAPGSVA
jgi:hypothetical protein